MPSLPKLHRHPGRRVVATGSLLFAALLSALLVPLAGLAPAVAADATVVPGLAIAPSTAAVGQVVTFTASVTNVGSSTILTTVLGVDVAPGLRAWQAVGSAHCTPRNLGHLVYCNVGGLAPQQTATFTFTVTPAAAGSYISHTYARPNFTGPEVDAYATLTVA